MHVKDPVCGQSLTLTDVAGSTLHHGWAYYFCSIDCQEQFEEAPGNFANSPIPMRKTQANGKNTHS